MLFNHRESTTAPQRDIVQLNGLSRGFSTAPHVPPFARLAGGIRPNQPTGINRGSPGKLFIEKQARNMWVGKRDRDFNVQGEDEGGIKERSRRKRAAIGITRTDTILLRRSIISEL